VVAPVPVALRRPGNEVIQKRNSGRASAETRFAGVGEIVGEVLGPLAPVRRIPELQRVAVARFELDVDDVPGLGVEDHAGAHGVEMGQELPVVGECVEPGQALSQSPEGAEGREIVEGE
jgi:hypothetical protein